MPTTTAKKATTTEKKPTTAKRQPRSKATAQEQPAPMKDVPCYSFPAISGIQSGCLYYSTMIPLALLPKLFVWKTEDMPAEMRSQRRPDETRIKKIADYVLSERYTFSSVTVTVDPGENELQFAPLQGDVGTLKIPMDSQLLIADGQHRIYGLQLAMQQNPELRDEAISCVIFLDIGLKRRQQIFHDLNNHVSKPNKSLNLLYDHGSDKSDLARQVMKGVPIFAQYTDTERTNLGKKSSKVFTFNAIEESNQYLFANSQLKQDKKVETAIAFWKAITEQIPEWKRLLSKEYAPSDVRQNLICGHAISLCGIAHLGFYLLRHNNWQQKLEKLELDTVDWNKTNPEFNNQIVFGGRIYKNCSTVREFGEWLWRRGMLSEEVAEDRIRDWMLNNFKGHSDAEIIGHLKPEPTTNVIAQQCFSELDLHCDASTLNVAWSNCARRTTVWPGNLTENKG
ncbi:MAG TPA: DNA sulfur modification protein DndB [Stenomitos sp.]